MTELRFADISRLAKAYRRQWALLRIALIAAGLVWLVLLLAYLSYRLPEAAKVRNPVTRQFADIWAGAGVMSYLLSSLAAFGMFLGRRTRGWCRMCLAFSVMSLLAWIWLLGRALPEIRSSQLDANVVPLGTIVVLIASIGLNSHYLLRLQAGLPAPMPSHSPAPFRTLAVLSRRTFLKFSLLMALAMPILPGLAVVYYLSGLLLENIYAYSYTRVLPTSWVEFTTATGNVPRFEKLPLAVQIVMLVTVVAKLVLLGLLIWCGLALIRWAWQRSRPSADELLSRNLVRPITLIRSFRDDAKALYGFSLASWLFFRKFRIEEILGYLVRQTGVLIAIGQPGDRSSPLGAYRNYFEGEDWRDAIIDWMAKSEFVVVIAGQTEGLAWELRQLKARNLLPKTIFVFPEDTDEEIRGRLQSISETMLGQSLQVPATGAKNGSLFSISFSRDGAMAVYGNARYAEDLRAAFAISRTNLSI